VIVDGVVVHEVDYPQPPERVWRALVDPTELGVWLMPTDFVAEVGRRFTFDASPSLGLITGEVLRAVPPRLLSCRWSGVFGETVVEFTLTPVGAGTRLRLEHRGWSGPHQVERDGFDAGWRDKLAKDLPAALNDLPDHSGADDS
jgi:uncharacterized protein YndB with AHSA1/START domain